MNYSNKYFVVIERELIQSKLHTTKNSCSPKQIATWSSMVESQRSKCIATEDQPNSHPNEILYSIFHGLPLKDVIHTTHISTMYKMMWLDVLAASPVLDFANHDFIGDSDQMLERAAATVTMCVCVCV
jgi:hypothetical protein